MSATFWNMRRRAARKEKAVEAAETPESKQVSKPKKGKVKKHESERDSD